MRYYFHIQDGAASLDDEGLEFADLFDVKTEAIQSVVDMLRDVRGLDFWNGEPWKLWVTDQPNGGGNTVLTLTVSARLPA